MTLQDASTSTTFGTADVLSSSVIVLTFDKAVSVSGNWFTVSCDTGSAPDISSVTTDDNIVYTIASPSSGYEVNVACSVGIDESLVVDGVDNNVVAVRLYRLYFHDL